MTHAAASTTAEGTRRKPLIIAGERIRLGQKRALRLQFGETYLGNPVTIPVYVHRARKNGPRVFLTGVMHGDELNGMGVVRHLLVEDPPKLLKGTLVLIPVVNVYGIERHTRYMPDRRDPNRCFPGSATGSLTSRLANALFTEVVQQCDYGIDFHSAALQRTNYPNVRADMRDPPTAALARAFGAELVVHSKGPRGSLRRAAAGVGVPVIVVEAGEVWKIEPRVVAVGVRGALNALMALGMVRGEPEQPAFQVAVNKKVWVRADQGGILGFHAKPGDLVREGETLATIYGIFGREQTSLTSPVNGIVLGMTTMPAIAPGGPAYHIARLPKRKLSQIQRKMRQRPKVDPYQQVQQDLATSITIQEQ